MSDAWSVLSDAVDIFLPYIAVVGVWARCHTFLRKHAIDLRAITGGAAGHWLALPVVCFVTPVIAVVGDVLRGRKDVGIEVFIVVFLLQRLALYALNIYLVYAFVFHGTWIVAGVFGSKSGSDAAKRLRKAFAEQQRHRRFIWVGFITFAAIILGQWCHTALVLGRALYMLP